MKKDTPKLGKVDDRVGGPVPRGWRRYSEGWFDQRVALGTWLQAASSVMRRENAARHDADWRGS